jgi:hypothetical protein
MKVLEVFKNSVATPLLSKDGICATSEAEKVLNSIKTAAKEKGVFITYWNSEKVTFTCIYMHTVKVPSKALKNLDAFKLWNEERINYFFNKDTETM